MSVMRLWFYLVTQISVVTKIILKHKRFTLYY